MEKYRKMIETFVAKVFYVQNFLFGENNERNKIFWTKKLPTAFSGRWSHYVSTY